MNPLWQKVIIDIVLGHKKKEPAEKTEYSPYEFAKAYYEFKITVVDFFRDLLFISLGILSATFGLKGFLIPNNFIDGGATGIALLIRQLTGAKLGLMLILVNIPFLLLGLGVIGRNFTIKAALAIAGLALMAAFINFKPVTDDKLLVAVFGGFFLGAGIGLTIRGGAVIDGTEVLALYLSKRLGTTVGDIITVINVIIFGVAAYFISIDIALYAIVTYLAASKTVDFVIEGIEEYTGVTIISSHNEEIKEMIINKLGRGVTVYIGREGFGKQGHTDDKNIIYTVVTRLEISKLNNEIHKIDRNAFVVMTTIKDIKGGMIKKRRLKH
ncbi:MAG TPA: YitT family protein [Chitinophagaceae bacterium]|nr:YitT family protein [Chitinophagaceae bacterium]